MNVLHNLLTEHVKAYPEMELTDMVKLLYQSEFGPGHMVEREEKSLALLKKEWASLFPLCQNENQDFYKNHLIFSDIGNELVRADIRGFSPSLLPPLNRLFTETANNYKGSISNFEAALKSLTDFCVSEKLFPQEVICRYLTAYAAQGYPPLSHSNKYRELYKPAYRVIRKSYAPYLTLFKELERLLSSKAALTICIDGNCAAGKSWLAGFLSDFFDCNVIHMDDFFLPLSLRSRERLDEPGGNIHYERFLEEVVHPVLSCNPVTFRRFSCRKMDYQDSVTLTPKPLTIIEGSYCMREEFREIYDYSVFLSCTGEEQISRIRQRNGEEMLQSFVEKWIPMENKYFETLQIAGHCDAVI